MSEELDLRKQYSETVIQVRNAHFQRLEEKEITPITGMIFNDYVDRLQSDDYR